VQTFNCRKNRHFNCQKKQSSETYFKTIHKNSKNWYKHLINIDDYVGLHLNGIIEYDRKLYKLIITPSQLDCLFSVFHFTDIR
jgi:hypothetical protein